MMRTVVVSSLLAILLQSIHGVVAFQVVNPVSSSVTARSVNTKLPAAVIVSSISNHHPVNDDETTYEYILNQAKQYAYSDTTTPNEAKQYLQYILELQSDCVAGTIINANICDNNIIELIDIVAHLREKATKRQNQFIMSSSKEMTMMTSVVTMVIAISMLVNTIPPITTSTDVIPFSAEEWRWAIRDGYLNTMVAHYMRHGGL